MTTTGLKMQRWRNIFWSILVLFVIPFPVLGADRPRINNFQRPKIIIPQGTEPCNVPDRSCPLNFKCVVHVRTPGPYWVREWSCVYNHPLKCPPGFRGRVEYRTHPQKGLTPSLSCEMAVEPNDWCGKRWHVAPGYYTGAWDRNGQPEFSCLRDG